MFKNGIKDFFSLHYRTGSLSRPDMVTWARISVASVKENPISLIHMDLSSFSPRDLKERGCKCDKFPDEFKFFWEVRHCGNGKKFQKDFIKLSEKKCDR